MKRASMLSAVAGALFAACLPAAPPPGPERAGPADEQQASPPTNRDPSDPTGMSGSGDLGVAGGGDGGPGASTPAVGSGGSGGGALSDCPACVVRVPPSADPAVPLKLLVALHGDEGRDFGLAGATAGVVGLWQQATDAGGYLLFAPACPAALGCNGAFSDWLAADGYDLGPAALAWIDDRVTELEQRYNIDRKREYLAGYSGGAYWLGAYAPARSSRFAAVAFIAGGMPAYHAFHGCPMRKLPGYFLGGDGDFRTAGQMSDTASAFLGCGQEIHLELVNNADHQATIGSLATGNAAKILTWFGSRTL